MLTERQLFEETRTFSTQAERMPACSSVMLDPTDASPLPSVGTDWMGGASEWATATSVHANASTALGVKTAPSLAREQVLSRHIFQAGK